MRKMFSPRNFDTLFFFIYIHHILSQQLSQCPALVNMKTQLEGNYIATKWKEGLILLFLCFYLFYCCYIKNVKYVYCPSARLHAQWAWHLSRQKIHSPTFFQHLRENYLIIFLFFLTNGHLLFPEKIVNFCFGECLIKDEKQNFFCSLLNN